MHRFYSILAFVLLLPALCSAQEAQAVCDSLVRDTVVIREPDFESILSKSIERQQYQECLELCDSLMANSPSDSLYAMVLGKYAEVYYNQEDYQKARSYLDRYLWHFESKGEFPNLYYSALYAFTLTQCYAYSEADEEYKKILAIILTVEDLKLDDIASSQYHDIAGTVLYGFAFNSFYQGKEDVGAYLLKLSGDCGHALAKVDYFRLSQCPTFANQIELKSKYIREFDEYIRRCDVPQARLIRGDDNQTLFWEKVQEDNQGYQKLVREMSREPRRKLLTKALNEIEGGKQNMQTKLEGLEPRPKDELVDSLQSKLFADWYPIHDFRIYSANESNAFATPYGDIYLTSGIVNRYHANKSLLLGVCAHEANHFLCAHSLQGLWQALEKQRSNKIAAGFLIGFSAALSVGAAALGAYSGNSYTYNNNAYLYSGIMNAFQLDSYYFKFKYSREQEINSDIVAYRFCESIGLGGYAYILALQLLCEDDIYLKADKDSDHPTLAYRVLLLKHLYETEHQLNSN